MSSTSKFTVVIAPGAWPLLEFFQPLMHAFEERSHSAICSIPPNSSYKPEAKPFKNPDMEYLREHVLLPLIDE
jgi:hypothetical protein